MTITCNGITHDITGWNLSAVADAVWDNKEITEQPHKQQTKEK